MKRKIAAALSIVMIGSTYVSPFVHAADKEVGGASSIAYVDTSAVAVVVPTDAALNFTLDPQGLVSIAEDSNHAAKTADELKSYSGRILGNNALIFANKSVSPVTVTTTFKVSKGATNIASDYDNIIDSSTGAGANLQFLAVPTASAINLAYGEDEIEAGNKDLDSINEYNIASFTGAANGILFNGTGTAVKTVLDAADYNYTYDEDDGFNYQLDSTNPVKAAAFVIAGKCNPYYDGYDTLDVAITATYDFEKATSTELNSATGLSTAGFKIISHNTATEDTAKGVYEAPSTVVTSAELGNSESGPTVAGSASAGFTITAPEGKEFDASTFKALYNGEYISVTSWGKKPTLGSNNTVWTLPANFIALVSKESDNSYKFTVKYKDANATIDVKAK